MKIFNPSDFGAKADGINNDAIALWKTLAAASDFDGEAQVLLEAGKTYRFGPTEDQKCGRHQMLIGGICQDPASLNCTAPISLDRAKNVHIKGENTKILIDKPYNYCNIYHSENIVIEGLIFDYSVHPYVKGIALEMDFASHKATFKTDRSLFVKEKSVMRDFGVLERPDSRYHMFTRTVTPVDADNFIYEIEFNDDPCTNKHFKFLSEYPLIIPVPGFGHCIERGFSIISNTNVTFKDCKIHSLARFGFALFNNDGIMLFDNVRAEKSPFESANIVGWRDLYHVKENRGRFVWKNCYAEYCNDDIFNISASTMVIEHMYSPTDIDFRFPETNGKYSGVRVGDRISVIDLESGIDYGESTIVEIVEQEGHHNRFRFDKPFASGVEGAKRPKAHVLEMVAPGALIENCDFRGTFRFRGPIEVSDTYFEVKRLWIDMFMPNDVIGEGPIPKHIHFTNCRFETDDEEEYYFHIMAQKDRITDEKQYHLEDIVFKNCEIPMNTVEIQDCDRPFVEFI